MRYVVGWNDLADCYMHREKFICSLTTTESSIRPSISGIATILKELSAICSDSNHALLLPIPAVPLISSTPTSTTSHVYRVRADELRSTWPPIKGNAMNVLGANFDFMHISRRSFISRGSYIMSLASFPKYFSFPSYNIFTILPGSIIDLITGALIARCI